MVELSSRCREHQTITTHGISSKLSAIVALRSKSRSGTVVRWYVKVLYAASLERVWAGPVLESGGVYGSMVRAYIDFSASY